MGLDFVTGDQALAAPTPNWECVGSNSFLSASYGRKSKPGSLVQRFSGGRVDRVHEWENGSGECPELTIVFASWRPWCNKVAERSLNEGSIIRVPIFSWMLSMASNHRLSGHLLYRG